MRIIFYFSGGPLDGKTTVGQAGEQDEAERFFLLTDHGRIGQRFRVASPYAVDVLSRERRLIENPHHFQQHRYEVVDRLDTPQQVKIRVRYLDR
jgi:hypothetical protein